MHRTRESRWCGIIGIIVTFLGGNERNNTRINGYPASWNRKGHPKNKNIWARLIQKIYEVDPLTCPKCRGIMRIISIIGKLRDVVENMHLDVEGKGRGFTGAS